MKESKIYAEAVEDTALEQYQSAMEQPWVVKGALMPDAHTGYSLPIGAVVATDGMILPSWVGYDIGCGMCAVPTSFDAEAIRVNSEAIFESIYRRVPVGFRHNEKPTEGYDLDRPHTGVLAEICEKKGALRQLGSLGSGNHFIEIGADENDRVWIVIHSGSRGIGHGVAVHYMRLASGDGKAREGHLGFSTASQEGKDYITDMEWCLNFALCNRREMIERVYYAMEEADPNGLPYWFELINRNHNHATERDGMWIHRKGATHAEEGMMGVIPGNMRDGSFIVTGKGNPESLWSSSHGAGRVLGRKKAKQTLSMDDFRTEMIGVTAKVEEATLDESPYAYKDIHEVMRLQQDLVDVVAHVKPIINIKA